MEKKNMKRKSQKYMANTWLPHQEKKIIQSGCSFINAFDMYNLKCIHVCIVYVYMR